MLRFTLALSKLIRSMGGSLTWDDRRSLTLEKVCVLQRGAWVRGRGVGGRGAVKTVVVFVGCVMEAQMIGPGTESSECARSCFKVGSTGLVCSPAIGHSRNSM